MSQKNEANLRYNTQQLIRYLEKMNRPMQLTYNHLAGFIGCSAYTVRQAIYEAQGLGKIYVDKSTSPWTYGVCDDK